MSEQIFDARFPFLSLCCWYGTMIISRVSMLEQIFDAHSINPSCSLATIWQSQYQSKNVLFYVKRYLSTFVEGISYIFLQVWTIKLYSFLRNIQIYMESNIMLTKSLAISSSQNSIISKGIHAILLKHAVVCKLQLRLEFWSSRGENGKIGLNIA